MGPELAAGASIASLGFDAAGSVMRGKGEKATQDWLAERDERKAELGRLRAAQTGTFYTENLNTTLASIDAIRAAASIDPTSPTTAALKAEETRISDRERDIRVGGLLAQSREDEASARFRREVGEDALLASYLGAGSKLLGGFGRSFARG